MNYLLDTNIISEQTKPKPNSMVNQFLNETPAASLYISVLTIGEIRKGIERLDYNEAKKQKLNMWLENDLIDFFAGRILPIDMSLANKWGIIVSRMKNSALTIDSLIAATAIKHNMILVTRNSIDFAKYPVEVFNPWATAYSMA